MADPGVSPLAARSRDALRRVREALTRAGFDEKRIVDLLGVGTLPSFRRRRQSLGELNQRTSGASPLESLTRLFLLGESVPPKDLEEAEPALLSDWAETGLAENGPSGLRATVELTPYEGLVVAADWSGKAPPDPFEVMGVAASTRALAVTTVRFQRERALDLGTGNGLLALLAARHNRQVIATDVNPRALDFARWNAVFNGVENVTFRPGDLFAPVRRESFDLIVCNPPFVLAPALDYLHTHSGRKADALCREIVRAAPAHLTEGGLCQIVCNWAILAQASWQDRLAGWLAGIGCDAWVLHSHTEDAASYARDRIAETAGDGEPAAGQLEKWLAYYERERIDAIGFGIITMRRREGSAHVFRWDRLGDIAGTVGTPAEKTAALRAFLEKVTGGAPTGSRS